MTPPEPETPIDLLPVRAVIDSCVFPKTRQWLAPIISAARACSIASKKWFGRVTQVFHVVDDRPPLEATWADRPIDEWDAPLWTAAKRGQAQFIVTENLDDGPPPNGEGLRQYERILFIHPDHFLGVLDYLVDTIESRRLVELVDSPSYSVETTAGRWSRLSPNIRAVLSQLLGQMFDPG